MYRVMYRGPSFEVDLPSSLFYTTWKLVELKKWRIPSVAGSSREYCDLQVFYGVLALYNAVTP